MVDVFTSGVTTSNGSGAYVKTRIPAIVKTGSTLVAFCEGRRVDNDFGDIEIIASQSTDGGSTWTGTDCIRVVDNGVLTAGNPVPIVNSVGHIVLLYVTQATDPAGANGRLLNKIVSTDAGSTWGASTSLASLCDPTWTWMSAGPCHGIRLTSGPHAGRLVGPIQANKSGGVCLAGVVYSDDDGSTWSIGTMTQTSDGVFNLGEPSVVELNDGRLALFCRNQLGSGDDKCVMYSSDWGLTFTAPVTANVDSAGAVQGSALIHTGTPNKALFYSTPENLSGSNRLDLRILRSLNGGTVWSEEEYINANAAYSDMVQTGPNSLGILYEQGVSPQYQRIVYQEVNLSIIHQVGTTTTANTGGTDATSITVDKPLGVISGHVLLAAITTNNANCTPPAGWTEFSDAGTNIRTQLFWKLAGGSEPANYNFSFTGGRPIVGSISAWSGVDATTPIAGVATPTTNAGGAEPQTTPSVTTNTAQRGVVMYVRSSYNSNSTTQITHTAGSSVTEVADNATPSATSNRSHVWYVDNSEFTNNTATKTGLAITASDTEEENVLQTFVLQTDGSILEYELGIGTETELINVTVSDSDSGEITDDETPDNDLDTVYYLDDGGINLSNARIQMSVSAVEENNTDPSGAAIRFRRSDEDNWWEFGMSPTSTEYILRKSVGGVLFTMSEPNLTRGAGDLLRVDCFEERINCYVNQTMVISITDEDLKENQTVGLRFSTGCVDTAVDNFYAQILTEDIRDELTFRPLYEVFVDWDKDGGLTIGDFETTLDGWTRYGTRPPDISTNNLFVRSGFASMEIQWNNWNLFQFDVSGHGFSQGQFGGPEYGNPPTPFKFNGAGQGFDDGYFAVTKFDAQPSPDEALYGGPGVFKFMENLVPGREYTLKAWVFVPEFGTEVSLGVLGISGQATTTAWNTWQELTYTYIATDTAHNVLIFANNTNPAANDVCYVDQVMNLGAYEDITCYLLNENSPVRFRYGRDQARSLASIAPGEVSLDLDNNSQIFSPDNDGSVLAGFLAPGKPMLIRATYNNQTVNLFHGFVDNYTLHPDEGDRYVTMTAMDVLQYLANAKITTSLYPSIQTGEAISVILDAVGWPAEKRSIDQGASTIRWWCEDDTGGLEAVQKLVEAEGLPSIAHVDAFGNFVFRSRHHRLLRTESKSIQAYIRSDNQFDEPNFSSPVTYDIGWKDIINQIKVDIEERGAIDRDSVWNQDELLTIASGETHTINVKTSDPFFDALIPTVEAGDIELKAGSGAIAEVNMTRSNGQSTTITITAGATAVTIGKIQLRAFSVPVLRTRKILQEDPESVTLYGPQTATNDFGPVSYNDMDMISQILLGHRAERLPVVNINLNNGHPIRISHMLNRNLSDRIHLVEMLQTFMDDDYFIEVLEHELTGNGNLHTLTIGCEKSREQLVVTEEEENPVNPTFMFDVAGQGFDDGYFSPEGQGFTLSNDLFILDQSVLGTTDGDGLGF